MSFDGKEFCAVFFTDSMEFVDLCFDELEGFIVLKRVGYSSKVLSIRVSWVGAYSNLM